MLEKNVFTVEMNILEQLLCNNVLYQSLLSFELLLLFSRPEADSAIIFLFFILIWKWHVWPSLSKTWIFCFWKKWSLVPQCRTVTSLGYMCFLYFILLTVYAIMHYLALTLLKVFCFEKTVNWLLVMYSGRRRHESPGCQTQAISYTPRLHTFNDLQG